jgi:hypothetical protein
MMKKYQRRRNSKIFFYKLNLKHVVSPLDKIFDERIKIVKF